MPEPTRKKRRLSPVKTTNPEETTEYDRLLRQIVSVEVDLEISLRRRLASTIEARIAWACTLQDALADNTSMSTLESYEDIATEALGVVETPSNIIFDRCLNPPTNIQEIIEHSSRASMLSEAIPVTQPISRKVRTSRPFPQAQGPKVLFIRNSTVSPPTIAKMVCPDCNRSDFTNLQGLLNHARLRHHREYGSHDECMQRCAVIVQYKDEGEEEGEAEWIAQNGIELSTASVPSLRRLFEIAVGDYSGFIEGFVTAGVEESKDHQEPSSSLLSQTLGHHKDSPALAPFLGRSPIRRCINVYDDDEIVDIDDVPTPKNSSWRMSFPHRNKARPGLDMIAETSISDAPTLIENIASPATASQGGVGTRFHVVARVTVSDRSVWIPPDRRSQSLPEHTHRWVVGVDSPSYSLHVSAFLIKMTVLCLTDPPPSNFTSPLSVTGPPFQISGSTDRPFLAKVTFTFVGPHNPPMDVEHWVELEPLHSAIHPVLGDEQVLDIELDRHTELMPIRRGPASTKHKSERSTADHPSPATLKEDEPYYEAKLRSLLSRHPMTIKDVKGRTSIGRLPYRVVANASQLRGMIPGRRLSIEWGRARAMKAAYEFLLVTEPPEMPEDAISLNVADVFRWLEDDGQFIRPKVDVPAATAVQDATPTTPPVPAILCGVCGQSHPAEPVLHAEKLVDGTCDVLRRCRFWRQVHMVDVLQLLGPANLLAEHSNGLFPLNHLPGRLATLGPDHSNRDLVATVAPEAMGAMRSTVQLLHLPCFEDPSPTVSTKSETERQLAPYALLATVTKRFVASLVRNGLNVALSDASASSSTAPSDNRSHRKTKAPGPRLLTPSHVIRGIMGESQNAASLCLAQMGVSRDESR
ncbi:hypothetical protein FIBSPDRAFT_967656 [Athelia psychrophila]|uniref:YEATS domain-containing protein n=1 Tax=Athelia psychrophila TaxID=1759441 RepID=A0A167VH55_9AGAM|nr:hypothetical protein FIBSPDRAFT_967656 [Fibularhizoctonia sp. CBS 109695]